MIKNIVLGTALAFLMTIPKVRSQQFPRKRSWRKFRQDCPQPSKNLSASSPSSTLALNVPSLLRGYGEELQNCGHALSGKVSVLFIYPRGFDDIIPF